MKLRHKYFILLLILLFISTEALSLRSVKHESFTDPAYTNYQAKRVLIMVNSPSKEMRLEIEKSILKYLRKADIKLITFKSLFPPTRNWTNEQVFQTLSNSNLDSWLVITTGARNKTVIPFMSTTNSNTAITGTYNSTSQYYGNNVSTRGNINANANTRSTTYSSNISKSTAEFNAILIDIKTGNIVWYSDLIVKAGGSLFTTNKGDAKGVSKKIVNVLIKDGRMKKK